MDKTPNFENFKINQKYSFNHQRFFEYFDTRLFNHIKVSSKSTSNHLQGLRLEQLQHMEMSCFLPDYCTETHVPSMIAETYSFEHSKRIDMVEHLTFSRK